jgi:hypothetical protein
MAAGGTGGILQDCKFISSSLKWKMENGKWKELPNLHELVPTRLDECKGYALIPPLWYVIL